MFKPMLAAPLDRDLLQFPVFVSPKLDGIRASVVNGQLLSRSLKRIPNQAVFSHLSRHVLDGLDGELIVGSLTDPAVFRNTTSGVMSASKTFDFTYHVFDLWNQPKRGFAARRVLLEEQLAAAGVPCIERVQHRRIDNLDDLDAYEIETVGLGFEGVMVNSPDAAYKFGRATAAGGQLLKLKRFEDSEAEVVEIEEEMFNGNEATTSELGRTKRSTAKAGLTGKGTMGALVVRDLKTSVVFNIGTGFTALDRAKQDWIGKVVKYKFFPVGVKDKPRHPVFLGERAQADR